MATPKLKNIEKTVEKLTELDFFRNFAIVSFNRHVNAVYHLSTEEHVAAKRALLITISDTQISIANKQLLFFFSLQKFTQQTEETPYLTAQTELSDPNMVRVKVQLSPSLLYFPDGMSVGKRYIQVPHVDESKLHLLKNFKFTHGDVIRLYVFGDKKQIKVRAISVEEGNRAINELLKIVVEKKKKGTAEKHGYTGKLPEDKPPGRLLGITSTCNELHIYHPHERPWTLFV
jgi:hypothetical protein